MKRKERFLAAINHKPVDRVPMYDFLFQQPLFEALIGKIPQSYNAQDAVELALAINHDFVWIPFGGRHDFQPRYIAADTYLDEWGTTFQHNFASWPGDAPVGYPIQTRNDLRHYQPPDPTADGRLDEVRKALDLPRDDLAIAGSVSGPWTQVWLLMGYEQICITLYEDIDLFLDLMRMANEYYLEAARLTIREGVDAMWIADDFGDSVRGFLKPDQFRRYVLPFVAELVEGIDSLGVPVLLHSCGHITEYLADLAQTKIAALHPMQRTAGMDLRWMKDHYGERFCLIGNIDSSRTLPYGTPEDVRVEVREALDVAAPGGGYILASDHSLHDGIPVENIVALFDEGSKYGLQR
jgi:uroporphyrinogen decarboxylase